MLDPGVQIRETIAYFFETFSRVGSASQMVKVFRNEGLLCPSRLRVGDTVVFRPLTAWTATRMLNNPRYAGVYAYGRRQYRRALDGKKQVQRRRDSSDWLACIPNADPGYISWERFQENLKILESNGRLYELARASPPREGAALLQGRAICGRCGRHFRVRYAARRGRQEAWYVCDRGHTARGELNCQSIAGAPIDEAVGSFVAEEMTPAAVELAIEIRREVEARCEEAHQLRCRAIERAQIEADLAQRRFMLVDPSNRLVADTLEREWNEKLRALAEAREERERARQQDHVVLDDNRPKPKLFVPGEATLPSRAQTAQLRIEGGGPHENRPECACKNAGRVLSITGSARVYAAYLRRHRSPTPRQAMLEIACILLRRDDIRGGTGWGGR